LIHRHAQTPRDCFVALGFSQWRFNVVIASEVKQSRSRATTIAIKLKSSASTGR
jgi:hypothetical protein